MHCAISAKFGVVVLKASMLKCRGSICHRYMCIVLCMNNIWCNGFPEMYVQLEEGQVGSICNGYMCIVLYMKCIWCNGFPEIYAQLEEGWGQSAIGICALCYIYM